MLENREVNKKIFYFCINDRSSFILKPSSQYTESNNISFNVRLKTNGISESELSEKI